MYWLKSRILHRSSPAASTEKPPYPGRKSSWGMKTLYAFERNFRWKRRKIVSERVWRKDTQWIRWMMSIYKYINIIMNWKWTERHGLYIHTYIYMTESYHLPVIGLPTLAFLDAAALLGWIRWDRTSFCHRAGVVEHKDCIFRLFDNMMPMMMITAPIEITILLGGYELLSPQRY